MEEPAAESYYCPNCGQVIAAAGGQLVQCPHCGEQFFTPAQDAVPESLDDHSGEQERARRESELSEVRIRQVSSLKRGEYRSRSWCIIGAVACLISAVQLVQMTVHAIRRGHVALPIGFCLAALACLMGGVYFARRARRWTLEIRQTSIPNPTEPPDLSTLSDGTQHAKALSEMHEAEQ